MKAPRNDLKKLSRSTTCTLLSSPISPLTLTLRSSVRRLSSPQTSLRPLVHRNTTCAWAKTFVIVWLLVSSSIDILLFCITEPSEIRMTGLPRLSGTVTQLIQQVKCFAAESRLLDRVMTCDDKDGYTGFGRCPSPSPSPCSPLVLRQSPRRFITKTSIDGPLYRHVLTCTASDLNPEFRPWNELVGYPVCRVSFCGQHLIANISVHSVLPYLISGFFVRRPDQ